MMKLIWQDAGPVLTRIDRGLPNVLPIPILIQGYPAVVLFDTGASCSAVRRSIAEAANLRSLHEQVVGGGSGLGRIQAEKWRAETVQIGPLLVMDQTWMVLRDEAFDLELAAGQSVKIDGLLGWDVLQLCCWQWDEKRQRLSVRASVADPSAEQELIGWDNMPMVQAETEGQLMRWGFDSGNTDTIGGPLLDQGLPDSLPLEFETLTGVDGSTQVPARRLPALSLRIGNAKIILDGIAVINRPLYPVQGEAVAGLLGADVLAGRGWRLDYPNRRLILEPKTAE